MNESTPILNTISHLALSWETVMRRWTKEITAWTECAYMERPQHSELIHLTDPPHLLLCGVTLHRSLHLSNLVSGGKGQPCGVLLRINQTFYESTPAFYASRSNLTITVNSFNLHKDSALSSYTSHREGKNQTTKNQNKANAWRGYTIHLGQHS